MIEHISLPVADLDRSAAFYDAVLSALGMTRTKEVPGAIGYGPTERPAPVFWLLAHTDRTPAVAGAGLHVGFEANDRAAVDAFHATAMEHGARDSGAPGPRPEYTQPFYGAFVIDPDGFKIEAVCRKEP